MAPTKVGLVSQSRLYELQFVNYGLKQSLVDDEPVNELLIEPPPLPLLTPRYGILQKKGAELCSLKCFGKKNPSTTEYAVRSEGYKWVKKLSSQFMLRASDNLLEYCCRSDEDQREGQLLSFSYDTKVSMTHIFGQLVHPCIALVKLCKAREVSSTTAFDSEIEWISIHENSRSFCSGSETDIGTETESEDSQRIQSMKNLGMIIPSKDIMCVRGLSSAMTYCPAETQQSMDSFNSTTWAILYGEIVQGQKLVSLIILVTTYGQLVCLINGQIIFQRPLPIPTIQIDSEIHLKLTNSSVAPILVLSHLNSILLIDAQEGGAVLKEFTNVGAYICAPLFHPLTNQLLIVPASEVLSASITSVTHGYVLSTPIVPQQNTLSLSSSEEMITPEIAGKRKRQSINATKMKGSIRSPQVDAQPNQLSQSMAVDRTQLHNWFVYDLPTAAEVRSDNAQSCPWSSVEPHGLWRVDKLMSIDAEAYNNVTWQRTVVADTHHTMGSSFGHSSSLSPTYSTTATSASTPVEVCTDNQLENVPGNYKLQEELDHSLITEQLTSYLAKLKLSISETEDNLKYKRAAVEYLRYLCGTRNERVPVKQLPPPTSLDSSSGLSLFLSTNELDGEPSFYLKALINVENAIRNSPIGLETQPKEHLFEIDDFKSLEHDASDLKAEEGQISGTFESEDSRHDEVSIASLQYTFLPNSTSIEISAVITNLQSHVLFNVHLVVFNHSTLSHASISNIGTTSGNVDVLLPMQSVCISAHVAFPMEAFVAYNMGYFSAFVALNWAEKIGSSSTMIAAVQHGEKDESDALLDRMKIMCNMAPSRHCGITIGRVIVDMVEAYQSYRALPWNKERLAELRQRGLLFKCTENQNSPGNSFCSANLMKTSAAMNGLRIAQYGTPLLAHGVRMCSYVPQVYLNLESPLKAMALTPTMSWRSGASITQCVDDQNMQAIRAAILSLQNSSFSWKIILNQLLSADNSKGFQSTLMKVQIGHGKEDENYDDVHPPALTNLSFQPPSEISSLESFCDKAQLLRTLRDAVVCNGILRVGPTHIPGSRTNIANALLYLRKILPKEVNISVHSRSPAEHSAAVRRACYYIMQELYLVARRLRRKAEHAHKKHLGQKRKSKYHQDGQLMETGENTERWNILAARKLTDLAIADLFQN